jgi:hypothetical protein
MEVSRMGTTLDIVAGAASATILAGCVWVWIELRRERVNGACQLCLALLAAERACGWVAGAERVVRGRALWHWALEALFGFVFLYVLHHVGELIVAARAASRAHEG